MKPNMPETVFLEEKQTSLITTDIIIPAYTSLNSGLIVELKLTAKKVEALQINAKGSVAFALEKSLLRLIEIMSSMKKSWGCLRSLEYSLESTDSNFLIKDARSASLALAIALLNIYREVNDKPQLNVFVATGIVRIDGTIEASKMEMKKQASFKQSKHAHKQFITSDKCEHLLDLEALMMKYQP